MKLNNKNFYTINNLCLDTIIWLSICKYVYKFERNIGTQYKYVVTDGSKLEYYYSDTANINDRKYFIFKELNDNYKILTSYNSSIKFYKCFINKNNNVFVVKNIPDKVPTGYKQCKFDQVLEYCTQLSLIIL